VEYRSSLGSFPQPLSSFSSPDIFLSSNILQYHFYCTEATEGIPMDWSPPHPLWLLFPPPSYFLIFMSSYLAILFIQMIAMITTSYKHLVVVDRKGLEEWMNRERGRGLKWCYVQLSGPSNGTSFYSLSIDPLVVFTCLFNATIGNLCIQVNYTKTVS
jgi:hypothetical protein